jgi:hypothetical protein
MPSYTARRCEGLLAFRALMSGHCDRNSLVQTSTEGWTVIDGRPIPNSVSRAPCVSDQVSR